MKTKKIHIAFIIHNAIPVPYFNWFAEKARNSHEFEFSFVFLNENINSVQEKMSEYEAKVFHIPFDNANKKKSLVTAFWKLFRLFRKIKPDIVHSHLFYDGIIAQPAAWLAGIKIRILTKQSTGFNWYYAPKAVWLDKMKNAFATHLIAVSGECRDFIIEKEKTPAGKITLVNHGVDINETIHSELSQIDFIKNKYNPDNKFLVVMVARYIDWKGYKYFIHAAAKVLKQNPNVRFLGVGTGPQENELRELIRELNLENDFILTGFIDRKLIPALYQSSNLYVHTAVREPFGFVIAEAMLNKLPLVTTPTGAAGDAVEHLANGYLVKYENDQEVADGILYFLQLEKDKLKTMGEAAAKKAEKLFSFETMWKGYTDLYKKSMTERRYK